LGPHHYGGDPTLQIPHASPREEIPLHLDAAGGQGEGEQIARDLASAAEQARRVRVPSREKMFGLLGSFVLRHSVIPEPEASRAPAAAEAEGFAAASAYAAGKSLATDEERSDVFRTYVKEMCLSAYRYAKSRPQAAGTSRSGPAAQPPPATSVAVVSGPVQLRGLPSASAPRFPSAPEE